MEELLTPTATHHTVLWAAELNSSLVRFEQTVACSMQSAARFIASTVINYRVEQLENKTQRCKVSFGGESEFTLQFNCKVRA